MKKKVFFPIVLGVMVALCGYDAQAVNLNRSSLPYATTDIPVGDEIIL